MQKNNLLTPLESLIYNRIKFFTEQGEYKYCSQSNGTLSTYFSRPKESISRTISKLKRLGYITEERDGTLRKLMSTSKENIFNYGVKCNDEVVKLNEEIVKCNEEVVNVNDKVVILKSLLNDEVVIKAMTKSLTVDDEVVKHNIKILIEIFNKDLNKDNKEINKEFISDDKFNEFWKLYPKKRAGSKDKAYKSFCKVINNKLITADRLIDVVKLYSKSDEVKRGFAKGCAAWLNDERFNDEYSVEKYDKKYADDWWRK